MRRVRIQTSVSERHYELLKEVARELYNQGKIDKPQITDVLRYLISPYKLRRQKL